MNDVSLALPTGAPGTTGTTGWTCPFCLLLCDDLSVRLSASGAAWELAHGDCAAARAGLAQFTATPSHATPTVDGKPCGLPEAVGAAARLLAESGQPLFGGLGTDVSGARALYRLASQTGAICDPARGAALMHSVRALQDRGGFTTTLAEVRTRADVIVCLGGLPTGDAADFFTRCGLGEGLVPKRHVAVLGGSEAESFSEPRHLLPRPFGERAGVRGCAPVQMPFDGPHPIPLPEGEGEETLAALGLHKGVTTESLRLDGDLFATVAMLAGVLARRAVRNVPAPLAALAERLLAARYAVIVGQTSRFPAHAALLVEAVNRSVATLNLSTRAGAIWLGGGNGAGTVNQVFTWLSGLPLRSRAGPLGLEHEPVCFDAARLLADGAVDCLLWVSSFDAACLPPTTQVPLIVLGHPALAGSAARSGAVFIPVSTPGIGSAGHLFRTDGGAVLPLLPIYRDSLPGLGEVLGDVSQALESLRAEAVA